MPSLINITLIIDYKLDTVVFNIFNIKYDENSIVNHTIKIASVLKTKFLGENNELNEFISKLQDTR